MAEINYSVLAAAAVLVLTAGAASARTNHANTTAALVTLEKSAYDAPIIGQQAAKTCRLVCLSPSLEAAQEWLSL
jgi:hypothetical protein